MPLSNFMTNDSGGLVNLLNKYLQSYSSSNSPNVSPDFTNQTFKYPIGQGDIAGVNSGGINLTGLLKSLLGQGKLGGWA